VIGYNLLGKEVVISWNWLVDCPKNINPNNKEGKKMKGLKIFLGGVLGLYLASLAYGQVLEDWVARYNGPENYEDAA